MIAKKILHFLLKKLGYKVVRANLRENLDMYLHKYNNYEEYKAIQIKYNKIKISNTWADESVLNFISNFIEKNTSDAFIYGLCHGSRNGFEQNYLIQKFKTPSNIIGTDISPTADEYSNSITHDFHIENKEWLGKMSFVYSNSLDQSFDPEKALLTWLNQVKMGGHLIIELSSQHEPVAASKMDPFGIKIEYFPYFLIKLFSDSITIQVEKIKKSNRDELAYIFIIRKLK